MCSENHKRSAHVKALPGYVAVGRTLCVVEWGAVPAVSSYARSLQRVLWSLHYVMRGIFPLVSSHLITPFLSFNTLFPVAYCMADSLSLHRTTSRYPTARISLCCPDTDASLSPTPPPSAMRRVSTPLHKSATSSFRSAESIVIVLRPLTRRMSLAFAVGSTLLG